MVQDQEKQNTTDKKQIRSHKTLKRRQLWQDIQDLRTN